MARPRRLEAAPVTTPDPGLLGPLFDEPQSFEFFQAVQLLEQLHPERAPVGEFADPADEVVRFATPSAVAFPTSPIRSLETAGADEPANMTVNFFGLTGPQGVLPLDYSMYAATRERAGDHTLKDFLGLFEHRIISLFYRAWAKSHPGTAAARPADSSDDAKRTREWLMAQLLGIVGLGTRGLQDRLPLADESLLFYSGLLSLPSRPAAALEQLVSDYFDVHCELEQFVGAWYPLERAAQTTLGDDFGTLGGGAVAGDEFWDQQGRVRLRIGPLPRSRYDEFLPGGASHDALRGLTRFYGNDQFDVEIQLVLARDDAPFLELGRDDAPVPLGWCTWLRTGPLDRDPDDASFLL